VPEFLSQAWFETLAAALSGVRTDSRSLDALDAPADGLRVGQIVTGVPDSAAFGAVGGEVRYTVVLSPGGSGAVVYGSTDSAQVTIIEDYPTAAGIASGVCSVSDMLSAGKVKLRGDTRALLAAADFLAVVARLLAQASST